MCEPSFPFSESLQTSDAIFVGRVVDIVRVPITTTHHGPSEVSYVRLQVLTSWRMADHGVVSVKTAGLNLYCGQFEIGKDYLIFAKDTSKGLFVDPLSRSGEIDAKFVKEDIVRLNSTRVEAKGIDWPVAGTFLFIGVLCLVVFIALYVQRRFRNAQNGKL